MSPKAEFFYDFVSPYTYLAAERLLTDRYAAAEVEWRPFFLGGIMKAAGNRPPAEVPAKGIYMLRDLNRLAELFNVPFAFPADFPVNSLLALRAATALKQGAPDAFRAYNAALFRAHWRDGRNIGDPAVWREVVVAAGLDADRLSAAAASDEVKEELKRTTAEAADRGAFGAPTFFVDGEMYFGVDRMFFVDRALGIVPEHSL